MSEGSRDNIRIDEARLWDTLLRSAEIGPGDAGGLRRLTLTDADRDARDQFAGWCRASGCTLRVDRAGNMFARYAGREDLPPVLIGSHLDTQVAGGRFDGILGVLAGLEVVRTLADHGIRPRRPIEVVNWTNEEGCRFLPPMAASLVFAGGQSVEWLHDRTDDDGLRLGDELARIGYLGEDPVGGRALDSYFELHIEQGPELEAAGIPLGIVDASYTSHGMVVRFLGETAHSGPTPMERRRNALVGAAKFLTAINDIGWRHAPVGKTTASRILVWPNKPGILPSSAETTVDLRHLDPVVAGRMRAEAEAALAAAAAYARVDYEIIDQWRFGSVPFDAGLIADCQAAADRLGVAAMRLPSQAGHDAYNLARVAPTALLFSPCIGGITHNEAEDIVPEQTWPSVNVLLQAVLRRADR